MTAPTSDSVETLRSQLDDAAKHIGRQRERIKALEEALRPFGGDFPTGGKLADDTRVMPLAQGGAYHEFCIGCAPEFTMGDLRRARALLATAKRTQSQSIADELVEVGEGAS